VSAFLEACLSGLNYVFRTEQSRAVGVARQPTENINSPPFAVMMMMTLVTISSRWHFIPTCVFK
jgi:hypothetical protein